MTTVVYYDGMLASDSQSTSGDVKQDVQKIFKVGSDRFAGAGNYSDIHKFREWLQGSTNLESLESFSAIVLKDGKAYEVEEDLIYMPIPLQGFRAIGSGAGCALASYHTFRKCKDKNFTAADIVRVACLVDAGSGGKIQKVTL